MSNVPETKPREKPRVAVVGGETPLGADLREVLAGSILGGRVKLIGSDDAMGAVLSEEGGEPVVITALDADDLNAAHVIFFAGTEASSRKAFPKVDAANQPMLIDLTRALEDRPEARLRAPSAEPPGYAPEGPVVAVIAHPSAIVTVAVLRALNAHVKVKRAIVNAFEPASERGIAGINELHQQTVSLFAFQPLPKAIYDEQIAFNILAKLGEEAPVSLAAVEERVEGHIATLIALDRAIPMPSLRVLQAPVLHGVSVSLWVELDGDFEIDTLEAALTAAGLDVRGATLDGPNGVGMAAQSGIAVGSIARDKNDRRALWLFAVADNYRLVAENALAVARGEFLRSAK
jgi:aspartate-semialdehyde dehydrogenase